MKILTIVAVLSTSFFLVKDQIKLEYSFQLGDEFEMKQITEQTSKQSIMGMDQTGENHYSGTMILKIIALSASNAKFEVQLITLKNESKNMMGETSIDSEGSADNAQNKVFKSMMRKTFYMTMTKTGIVERVENVEKLWSDIGNLELDEATQKTMRETLGLMINEGSLKNGLEQAFVPYPDGKIKKMQVWTSNSTLPLDFPIRCENTWQLESVASNQAVVIADGVYTTTDKDKIISLPVGLKAKVDLAGTQKVKAMVDVKSGWPGNVKIHSALKGKMILMAGGMLPQDMEVPMEIFTETVYTIQKNK